MNNMQKDNSFNLSEIFLFLIIGIVIVMLFSKVVPLNMDEFLFYHPIICNYYPWNKLNTFRESCQGFDLNFLNMGPIIPLRAFPYIGSFPCIYYYPIFLIWKSPLSARLVGVIFLMLQAFLLSKIFRIRALFVFLGLLLFFPYFFQHMVDTGPIGFQTTCIFLLYFLANKWFTTITIGYPLFIAVIIFLNIWTKPTFFWLLPGISIIFLLQIWENRHKLFSKKESILLFIQQAALSILLLIALLSILFLSTEPSNSSVRPYINLIGDLHYYTFQELLRGDWLSSGVVRALINPLEATQRIFEPLPPTLLTYLWDILLYLWVPLILVILWKHSFLRQNLISTVILYISFILTLFIIIRTKNSLHMHHAILAFPFLILSILSIISLVINNKLLDKIGYFQKRFLIMLPVIFYILNAIFFNTFYKQPIRNHDDPSKVVVNSLLNSTDLAKKYFYVVIDWGMYYYQGLYGPKEQSVLYMEPLFLQGQIDQLKELSRSHNRKLLFIYNSRGTASNIPLIFSSFGVKRWDKIDESSVWQVLIENI